MTDSEGMTSQDLSWIAHMLDYSLFIVTTAAAGERSGCLVGFTTQCSIKPLRFLVLLSKKNRTYRLAERANALGVHLVPDDRRDLAELFGGTTGDDVDKFKRCSWRAGIHDVPIVDGCPSWFIGTIIDRHDSGDHVAFFLKPEQGAEGRSEPLHFRDAKDISPGHEP